MSEDMINSPPNFHSTFALSISNKECSLVKEAMTK